MSTRSLLLAPIGLLISGLGVLYLKAHPVIGTISPAMLLGLSYLPWLAAVILFSILVQAILIRRKLDIMLFPMALMLSSLGIIEIARLKPSLLIVQLRWLLLAMLLMILVIRFSQVIRRILAYPYILGLSCIVLLILPLIIGTEIGGSRNWIVFGPISVQPSEFGKIHIVFFLAAFLSDHRRVLSLPARQLLFLKLPPVRFIAPLIVIWGIAVLMFVVARDLGSALLFFGIATTMTFMATGNKSYVFLSLIFVTAASIVSYKLFNHVRVRFDIWLNPWQDPNGMAYQIVQSLFSIGTGGIWGAGFGFGHPGFIPEVHTDFIFSAVAEELGLIATLMLMVIYICLFWRGTMVALSCRMEKDLLVVAGSSILLFMQAFIIIAGVTKFIPLTGITLPFISYGGSSMLASFFILGTIISYTRRDADG